jgi:hypothetical protein
MNFKLPLKNDDPTTVLMKRVFHNMKQVLAEDNVRSTFMQIEVR